MLYQGGFFEGSSFCLQEGDGVVVVSEIVVHKGGRGREFENKKREI